MSAVLDSQRKHLFYTWTAQNKAAPLEITGGKGPRFQTADGTWWWDLGSSTWNANLGHGHEGMRKALCDAASIGLIACPSAAFPAKARAGELLSEISPAGLNKSFICLSGAEANENAIKMARLVTGRSKIVARTHSYHGATLAMLSLSGDPRREPFEPGMPGVLRFTDPYCYRCKFGLKPETCQRECALDLETTLLQAGPETVAAIIVEGMTGANGVFPAPTGYFTRLREICDRYGVLMISDEVLSGFGRTGKWFAIDHEGVIPDMITCAKGLTAGYAPGGAVIVNDKIASFFEDHTLFCGLTTYAHPLICSAICAAIECYRSEEVIDGVADKALWLQKRLLQLQKLRPFVGDVRGRGLLWALELVQADNSAVLPEKMDALYAALKKRHVYTFRRDNFLYMAPPLIINIAELDEVVTLVEQSLDEVLA